MQWCVSLKLLRTTFVVGAPTLIALSSGCQSPGLAPHASAHVAPRPDALIASKPIPVPMIPSSSLASAQKNGWRPTQPTVLTPQTTEAIAKTTVVLPATLSAASIQNSSPMNEASKETVTTSVIQLVSATETKAAPAAILDVGPGPAAELDTTATQRGDLQVYPLDLPTALRLSDANSLEIELARNRYASALNREQAAAVIWLPDLIAGPSYQFHDGQIQRAIGEVFDTRRNSLFVGGGPVLNWDLDELCYAKLSAHQVAHARYSGAGAIRNQALLDIAEGYFDLQAAHAAVAVANETKTNAERLTKIMESFVNRGVGFQADAARALTEFKQRQTAERLARERTITLSASLARRLHLDPRVQLIPIETRLVPLDLWVPQGDANSLVELAMQHRPEIEEARWLVDASTTKLDQARLAPFLPKVQVGFTAGGFGGGYQGDPNGFFNRFDNREDLSASAVWQLKNLGLGDRYRIQNEQLELRSAELQLARTVDRVSEEVVAAQESVISRHEQLTSAREAVAAAIDSLDKYLKRIREGAALPMEAVQSIRALDSARGDYLQVVTAYNKAQYRLFTATGNAALDAQNSMSP